MSANENEIETRILEYPRMLNEAIKWNLKLEKRSKEINEKIIKIQNDLNAKAPSEHSEIDIQKFEKGLFKLDKKEKKLVNEIKDKDLIIADLVSIVEFDAVKIDKILQEAKDKNESPERIKTLNELKILNIQVKIGLLKIKINSSQEKSPELEGKLKIAELNKQIAEVKKNEELTPSEKQIVALQKEMKEDREQQEVKRTQTHCYESRRAPKIIYHDEEDGVKRNDKEIQENPQSVNSPNQAQSLHILEHKLKLLYAHKNNHGVNLPLQAEAESEGKSQEKQVKFQNISSQDQAQQPPKQKLRTPGDKSSTSSIHNVFKIDIIPAFFNKAQSQAPGTQIYSNNFPGFKK